MIEGLGIGEWELWHARGPSERAQDALELLAVGGGWGPFPLDHVGWCEARGDVERVSEALGFSHESFPSVVLARELSLDLRITRIRVGPGKHLELFWLPDGRPPTPALLERSHLAFRAPDVRALERVARSFDAEVRAAGDGVRLAYLLPWLELIAPR